MRTGKTILLVILCLILAAELVLLCALSPRPVGADPTEPSAAPTKAPAAVSTEAPTEEPTEEPTEAPTEAPTEPPEERYTLSFAGDCTFGSNPNRWNYESSFIRTVGKNYDYPFANVRTYFAQDDLTLVNLEGVLADEGRAVNKTHTFRGPTAYTQILTGSSVEAVTLANNHSRDFGEDGYNSTRQALEEAGVFYAEAYSTTLITLDRGLVVGLYGLDCSLSAIDTDRAVAGVQQLKQDGAELIIVAIHWGSEGNYRPSAKQQKLGRALIDAGAHIVWGHHPHVLQPVEAYNGGIIYYSLGNFAFGGNSYPKDYDSALLRQEVIKDAEGHVTLGELTLIPCSSSSVADRNNYQPTPCEAGSKMYNRILSKLDGSYRGADLTLGYGN